MIKDMEPLPLDSGGMPLEKGGMMKDTEPSPLERGGMPLERVI